MRVSSLESGAAALGHLRWIAGRGEPARDWGARTERTWCVYMRCACGVRMQVEETAKGSKIFDATTAGVSFFALAL